MSAVSQLAHPFVHTLFRSLLPRNQRLHIPNSNYRYHRRTESAALRLIGHLAVTSIVFLGLTVFVWVVSWALHIMHSMYPLSDEIFRPLHRLELFLAYVDASATGLILLNAIVRYVIATFRGNS